MVFSFATCQVVVLLKQRNIKVTSVDFLRFTWLNKKKDQEIEDDEDDGDGDEVEDGDVLGEGTSDTVGGTQFTDTEGGEQHTDAALLDTSIAVGGVGGVEFVAVRGRDQLHLGTSA